VHWKQLWLLLQRVLLRARQRVKQLGALQQLQVVGTGTIQQQTWRHVHKPAMRNKQQPAQQML
jgi:hypothetical protein